MDERLAISLWMVGGGGLGAVLGAAFGALTGVLYARNGGAAGTRLARRIVELFLDTAQSQSSSTGRAALIGAADGFLFLGILGLVVGALLGLSGRAANELLVPSVVGSVLLVSGAAFFGGLAYSLARNGVRAVLCFFAGGLLGTFVASIRLGAENCLMGTVPGLFVGILVSFLPGLYAPKFRAPRADKSVPPHLRPNGDAFRKPDASGEQ